MIDDMDLGCYWGSESELLQRPKDWTAEDERNFQRRRKIGAVIFLGVLPWITVLLLVVLLTVKL